MDLEESIGTVETTKAAYDKILELRIANAQIIVNYAAFLEENKYFEECFKVYERGVELFTYPVAFEIWNIYLSKFVKRYVRDLIRGLAATYSYPYSFLGWLEAGTCSRLVRTRPGAVSCKVLQSILSYVWQAGRRAWIG